MIMSKEEVNKVIESIGKDRFAQLMKYFLGGQLTLADIRKIPMNELENLHQLGRQHIVRKNYSAAAKVMKMLVHVYPRSAEFWGTYGIALQNTGDFLQARTAYAAAIEMDKTKMELYVYAAECELMLQNSQFALDIIKPVFHLKNKRGKNMVQLLKRAQRIKTIAENMESGPNDMPAMKKRAQERAALNA
jgi:tetratricopeptide (TPR) repeat protein